MVGAVELTSYELGWGHDLSIFAESVDRSELMPGTWHH
jgi:hypothetical protein